ncbi:MAG TPA: monovalent cation/H(+) antiporter subunit G [Acidimicrobiales bacterium]|nr:monovalent cation/H(+) antiporter subunit G [Acidimicrobiales bacterium]
MSHEVALALVSLGTAVTVASCLGAVAMRSSVYDRMHFITPITSLGCPLVAVGLSVEQGLGLTTASILLVGALLFMAGPVLEAAVGRAIGQVEGRVDPSSPE